MQCDRRSHPSATMRASTALLVRSIVSKLHPPGPATQRESQQLLRALDGAFKRRLDEAHPAPPDPNTHDPLDEPPYPSRSASTHFDSILQHPLFQSRPHNAAPAENSQTVDLFDSLLREDSLNMDTLRQVAVTHLSNIKHARRRDMTKLAPKLAAWMATASLKQRTEFFGTYSTLSPVLSVMFREGAHSAVWDWLKILHDLKPTSDEAHPQKLRWWLDVEDDFVSLMIRDALIYDALNRKTPVAAAQHFVAASAHRARGSLPVPLVKSWSLIASYTLSKRREHGFSKALFEDILKHSPPLDASPKAKLSPGFLAVYSSDRPTAAPLYHDLHNEVYVIKWAKWKWRRTAKMQQALLRTILDASQLALQQGNASQAKFFLDFAQTHFPDIISREEPSTEPAQRLGHAREELEQRRVPGTLTELDLGFG